MSNQELYYYGIKSKVKTALYGTLGIIIGLVGLVVLALSPVVGLLMCALAVYLLILSFKASADVFDYQQRSGNRIHKGDGWN